MVDGSTGLLAGNELIGGIQNQAGNAFASIQNTIFSGTLGLSQSEMLIVVALIGFIIILWKAESIGKWVMVAGILIIVLIILGVFNF